MAQKRSARRQTGPAPAPAEQPGPSALFRVCMTAALLALYAALIAKPIDLTTSDLGRHLKNGELFFQRGLIAGTNLYSYTHPDHPFVNHHWGSGVIFYLIESAAGFSGLSLFFIAASAAALWLFFASAARHASFGLAVMLTVLALPVLITRHEIRPELFSYVCSGLFWKVLSDYRERRRGAAWLTVLPFLQLLWVNLHIYFFIGLLLISAFLLEALIALVRMNSTALGVDRRRCATLATLLCVCAGASCVNPAGLRGALYPLMILREYEFPVIENYSVPGILAAGFQFLPLIYFLLLFAALCLSWLYVALKDRASFFLGHLLLSSFFAATAWATIRNLALFAFFALPLTAANLRGLSRGSMRWLGSASASAGAAAALALLLVLLQPDYFGAGRGGLGIGIKTGNLAAMQFMRRENLQGPIFNGYDLGGYLIYALFPSERVYVDNRPETYPPSFFAEDYLPLLVSEEKWRAYREMHRFNAIVINPGGRSAAMENFAVRRMFDPDWAAVFFDKDILVLVRRFGPNQPIITRHELPRDAVLRKVE